MAIKLRATAAKARIIRTTCRFPKICYIARMSTVAEIEAAIEKLPPTEQQQLREWFGQRKEPRVSVLTKLRALAGTAKNLPTDLAANHDHYLHGTPKRS
jgi:hypothetical protein